MFLRLVTVRVEIGSTLSELSGSKVGGKTLKDRNSERNFDFWNGSWGRTTFLSERVIVVFKVFDVLRRRGNVGHSARKTDYSGILEKVLGG